MLLISSVNVQFVPSQKRKGKGYVILMGVKEALLVVLVPASKIYRT